MSFAQRPEIRSCSTDPLTAMFIWSAFPSRQAAQFEKDRLNRIVWLDHAEHLHYPFFFSRGHTVIMPGNSPNA